MVEGVIFFHRPFFIWNRKKIFHSNWAITTFIQVGHTRATLSVSANSTYNHLNDDLNTQRLADHYFSDMTNRLEECQQRSASTENQQSAAFQATFTKSSLAGTFKTRQRKQLSELVVRDDNDNLPQ